MKSRKALAFAVVAIILAIQQSYALKCWYCAGANVPIEIAPDKWCLDPFNATTAPKTGLDECYFGACLKVVASEKDVILVIRDCVFPDFCSSSDIVNEPSLTHCSTCKTDGCNKATNFSPVILLVAISTVTSMIIRL